MFCSSFIDLLTFYPHVSVHILNYLKYLADLGHGNPSGKEQLLCDVGTCTSNDSPKTHCQNNV